MKNLAEDSYPGSIANISLSAPGSKGFSGDGGRASFAHIADPENRWVRKDGALLITVRDNARLRIVTPDGIINTLAGEGPTSRHDYYGPISGRPLSLKAARVVR